MSLKLKICHKLLLYVILLYTIHHHNQTVIAFQDATVASKTLLLNDTTQSISEQNNGSSPTPNQSDETSNGSYDLILHGESNWSASGFSPESTTSQRLHQLSKHTYNVTRAIGTSASTLANIDVKSIISNKTEGDDLSVSDSRMIAKSVNAKRSDEVVGDYMSGEDDVQSQMSDFYNGASTLDNYADAASSDQIEQRVMKELTKLLSKGMAGATDKVKLEKLERWKRRQKERKVMKDNRAKLFEDLLTAAINTHPGEAKKKSKKRTGMKETDGGKAPKSSMPILSDALQNVDPELAQDAESVLQHLQGISAVFETPTSVDSTDEANSYSESENADDSKNSDGEKESNKKNGSDRPFVRSFKKIKQQFKHRRNQLDQIKKIFNVELAINPKDGSLVGKTSNKKKDYREVGDFNIYDESTTIDYPSTSRSENKKKANRISKMNELSTYLMENPEILASVMAELTVDSDPSRPLLDSSNFHANENSHSDYSSDQPKITAVSRKLSSLGHHYGNLDNERLSFDSQQNAKNHFQYPGPSNDLDPSEFTQRLGNRYRRHNTNRSLQGSSSSYASGGTVYHEKIRNTTQTISPTETLLLKTLRERQLMNLMRLEMLMAERQQSSSNRSNSYADRPPTLDLSLSSSTSPPPSPPLSSDEREGESSSPRSSGSNNKYPHLIRHQSTSAQKNQTDDEVLHHFMIMNTNTPLKLRQKWIEQQVEQQDQLNDGHRPEGNNIQNDLSNRSLSRFKDWRDASSRSSDATSSVSLPMYRQSMDRARGNVTWLPYDLSTGGSSKSIDSTASKKMNGYDKSNKDKSIGVERFSRDYSDFSITRSGLNSYDRSQSSGKSMFMTRSSAAHDESTTSSPTTKDEQMNQEVSEELLGANDEKAHADDVDMTRENRDISQEEIEAQLMATDKPKAVNYFSSYKNENSNSINKRRRWATKTKAAIDIGKASDMKASMTEELGAIWA